MHGGGVNGGVGAMTGETGPESEPESESWSDEREERTEGDVVMDTIVVDDNGRGYTLFVAVGLRLRLGVAGSVGIVVAVEV